MKNYNDAMFDALLEDARSDFPDKTSEHHYCHVFSELTTLSDVTDFLKYGFNPNTLKPRQIFNQRNQSVLGSSLYMQLARFKRNPHTMHTRQFWNNATGKSKEYAVSDIGWALCYNTPFPAKPLTEEKLVNWNGICAQSDTHSFNAVEWALLNNNLSTVRNIISYGGNFGHSDNAPLVVERFIKHQHTVHEMVAQYIWNALAQWSPSVCKDAVQQSEETVQRRLLLPFLPAAKEKQPVPAKKHNRNAQFLEYIERVEHKDPFNALHYALSNGLPQNIAEDIFQRHNMSVQKMDKNNPLTRSIWNELFNPNPQFVRFLITKGVNAATTFEFLSTSTYRNSSDSTTVLQRAIESLNVHSNISKKLQSVALIAKTARDLNVLQTPDGQPLLFCLQKHKMADEIFLKVVKLLAREGLNIGGRNTQNQTLADTLDPNKNTMQISFLEKIVSAQQHNRLSDALECDNLTEKPVEKKRKM